MGMKKLVKILVPKRMREMTKSAGSSAVSTENDDYGFGPLKVTLSNNDEAHRVSRITKSLQWSPSNHSAVITIQESKVSKHYDYRGYDLTSQGPSAAAEEQRTLFFGALGHIPFRDLVIQSSNSGHSNRALFAVMRLRDLTLYLRGGQDALKALTLSGLILVANGAEVEAFAKALRGMYRLWLLKIHHCSLVVVDQVVKGSIDNNGVGWDPILRACNMMPALESLHLTDNIGSNICPVVLLKLSANRQNPTLVKDTLPHHYLETLLRFPDKPKHLKELSLSCVWNKSNEKRLTSLVQGHHSIETLDLSLRMEEGGPSLSSFLESLTINTSLKQIFLRAPNAAVSDMESIDRETWKNLREQNKTLLELVITPYLPPLIQALNDAWLEMNWSGCFDPHRLEDTNDALWTHVLSHPRVAEDLSLVYEVLSKAHPVLI